MIKCFTFSLAAIIFAVTPFFAQERYVKPVDEANLNPSFAAFRVKLIAAVERRDAKHILSILDPKINLSFGGDQGIADFKSMWKIESKSTQFWNEFMPIIKNGGSFFRENGKRTNLFYAPYSFDSFPEDLDAFEHFVIFGSNVNLRESPDSDSRIVDRLSYNVVKLEADLLGKSGDTGKMGGWRKVKTLGGLSGFVKSEFVRSPIDYRAGFEKKRGIWKMVAFIAGD